MRSTAGRTRDSHPAGSSPTRRLAIVTNRAGQMAHGRALRGSLSLILTLRVEFRDAVSATWSHPARYRLRTAGVVNVGEEKSQLNESLVRDRSAVQAPAETIPVQDSQSSQRELASIQQQLSHTQEKLADATAGADRRAIAAEESGERVVFGHQLPSTAERSIARARSISHSDESEVRPY